MKSALKRARGFVQEEVFHLGILAEKPAHLVYLCLTWAEARSAHSYAEAVVITTVVIQMFNKEIK